MKKLIFYFISGFYFAVFSQTEDLLVATDSTAYSSKTLSFRINDLSFIKNNEYFNLIADGYTLFGNRIDMEIRYRPHKNYDVSAGIMLLKYYGLNDFSASIPYFTLRIEDANHTYYFGKLYTDDNHHLSRQLYDFERHLDGRSIENGIEHRYNSPYWVSDTWLEWEHFIQKYDDERESLNFGHYSAYTFSADKWQLQFPLQIYAHHRGGQINKRSQETAGLNNALVVANLALGAEWKRKLVKNDYVGIRFDAFYHFINSDNTEEFHFENGKAYLWQIFYQNHYLQAGLNYWKSDQFVSPKGDDMFQSVSRRVDKYLDDNNQPVPVFAQYTEADRELLYASFAYKKKIYPDLYLAFSTDIFYQLNESRIESTVYNTTVSGQLDYAMGLYLIYRFDRSLLKLK